jgi:uncharacterized phage infection (PIP) family protein YhgE
MGQLLAWYDNSTNKLHLAEGLQRSLEAVRRQVGASEPYARGYRQTLDSFDRLRAQVEGLQARALGVESQVADARTVVTKLYARYVELARAIQWQKGIVRQASGSCDEDGIWTPDSNYDEEVDKLAALENEQNDVATQGNAALAVFNDKTNELNGLRGQIAATVARFKPDLRLEPPAVDGVVTPPLPMPLRPWTTSAPAGTDSPPAAVAAGRLQLARAYLDNSMADRAGEILRDLVDRYPRSAAADEAAALLAGVANGPKNRPDDRPHTAGKEGRE